jgi:hypothetical protein
MLREQKQALLAQIKERYGFISPYLSERAKRIWAASESNTIGRGGDSIVYEATGISRVTITKGKKELQGAGKNPERIRQKGGGRKRITYDDPLLLEDLNELIEPCTRGDPESPLRWTCKSTYKLSKALNKKGHKVSQKTVYSILQDLDYSLQANRKKEEGNQNPDRDAQFNYIYRMVKKFQKKNQPVVSVDAKKKENIGNYSNAGREWEKKGKPRTVNTYDFPDKKKGKACLYGIFDIFNNEGWMNVGISSDTAEFAVESIRRWWKKMGRYRYPDANQLLITADGGGSNSYRTRLWKREIQRLSNETHLKIRVCHFPPGTSKWNKIEHQMFSFVSKNWRGHPLDSLVTVVNLISNTTTEKGLHIESDIDKNIYEKGIKINDNEMNSLNIKRYKFHGEWNYKISPQK